MNNELCMMSKVPIEQLEYLLDQKGYGYFSFGFPTILIREFLNRETGISLGVNSGDEISGLATYESFLGNDKQFVKNPCVQLNTNPVNYLLHKGIEEYVSNDIEQERIMGVLEKEMIDIREILRKRGYSSDLFYIHDRVDDRGESEVIGLERV